MTKSIHGSLSVKGLKVVVFLHFALFFILGFSRHWGYMTSINDLGVFDQVVWNTSHGEFFRTTINPFRESINWLGFHFQPILILFVPFYWLYAGVEWFIAAQAAALAFAARPIFLLAEHVLKSERLGVIWALVYLFNPFLLTAGSWDFHPISLAVPFIATAFLAVVKKKAGMLFWSSLVILACKEHLGLMVAGFGVLWWIRNRTPKTALAASMLGFAHFFLVMAVVMPFFSPIDKPVMLGDDLGQLSRYGWLGGSPAEIAYNVLAHPSFLLRMIVDMKGFFYWLLLLVPFLLVLPLVGAVYLIPGLADLAANTLSMNPMPRSIFAYHSVGLVPVFTVAAIHGVKILARLQGRFSIKELSIITMLFALWCGYFFMPLPLKGAFDNWSPVSRLNWVDPQLEVVKSILPGNSSLSVQANVGAHFSQRRRLFSYPDQVGKVDAIVLRLDSPTTNINNLPDRAGSGSKKKYSNSLDGHLQMERAEYLASIECLLRKDGYGVAYWGDPWLVLSRGSDKKSLAVEHKIGRLRNDWQIDGEEFKAALANCRVNDL